MSGPENDCPPVGGATEGQCIALEAHAVAPYSPTSDGSKPAMPARILGVYTRQARAGADYPQVSFRASTGSVWAFVGKKGRVLQMLATMAHGVTQWDCLPWHTRLGGTIHALREAGLAIETVREGDFRHARYFLRTPGCLLIQAQNSVGPVILHRATP